MTTKDASRPFEFYFALQRRSNHSEDLFAGTVGLRFV
jgi:hypothetical protein